jgi:hypothetical protein
VSRGRALAAFAMIAACGRGERGAPPNATTTASTTSTAAAAPASASSTTGAKAVATPPDPDEERLRRATIASLVVRTGPGVHEGVFDATLKTPRGEIRATVQPALVAAPNRLRGPYAFHLLARALGMRVVPAATVRRVPVDELGAAFSPKEAKTFLQTMRVQNDGTIDVLLAARSSATTGSPWEPPRGTPFDPIDGPGTATWDRWASAAVPEANEDAHLLRDYLEMLVLDYLAANVGRQAALRVGASSIVLADNATAFPLHVERPLVDRLLRKLRRAGRFPRGVREALEGFDRTKAKATFDGGPFEEWLLSPRTLVELDERRLTLLTLVEARVAERGADAVLVL